MNRIGILPNEFKDNDLLCTAKVIDFLSKKECVTYVPEKHRHLLSEVDQSSVFFVTEEQLFSSADILVSIGGDGTMLEVSHLAADRGLPILGINMGTVGFMTELEVGEIPLLDALFSGEYSIEKRMMLDVNLVRSGKTVGCYRALNDVVLFKGITSKLIEINFFCNGNLVTSYRSDGLIVATPTGSTAYSLSAGGAVIDPGIDALCVTPLSSHAFLNSFPMVYSAENELSLEVARERDDQVYLSADGMENVKILFGDRITIKRSALETKLIRIKNTGFYEAVYKKLSERGNA